MFRRHPSPPRTMDIAQTSSIDKPKSVKRGFSRSSLNGSPNSSNRASKPSERDLPRLLAENRYLQHVAYRGNELVAIAATSRQLSKKLANLGFTDQGELFTMPVAPLEIDEDDDRSSEEPSSNPSQP